MNIRPPQRAEHARRHSDRNGQRMAEQRIGNRAMKVNFTNLHPRDEERIDWWGVAFMVVLIACIAVASIALVKHVKGRQPEQGMELRN